VPEKGRIRKMFPGGSTTVGFYNRFQYIIGPDAARIFVIKGGPGVGKSTFMDAIGKEMVNRGYDVEHHHCSSDPDSLDALVIPSLKIALLDGTAPHIVDPKNPGAVDEIINLGEYWKEDVIVKHREQVLSTNKKVSRLFNIAYDLLRQSGAAYEEWKGYMEPAVDGVKYNRIARLLVENIFEGITANDTSAPQSRHLFGSAITPKGLLDYKETLLTKEMRIFSIAGQPGTGVKQLIARAAQAAEEKGLYTEQFHCPYEPDKLDLLIIPAINTALMNTSQPYHFNLGRLDGIKPADEIDLDICIRKDAMAEYEPERLDAELRSRDLLEKAIAHLTRAKAAHDDMEEFYIQSMDYDMVKEKRDEVLKRILNYI
jgi:hypothetical protein